MARIKRYKLIDGFAFDEWKDKYNFKDGGNWVCQDSEHYILKSFSLKNPNAGRWEFEFSIYLCIPSNEKLNNWNDYECVLMIDDDFLQPYIPFYKQYGDEVEDFWCLEQVINKYNEWMDSLEFLEEKNNE
jgi:hypothetical protein